MKLVKEHIYERFTQDSDPIKDMDIGSRSYLRKIWKIQYEKIGKQNITETYKELFSIIDNWYYMNAVIMGLYLTLFYLVEEMTENDNDAYELGINYLKAHRYERNNKKRFNEIKQQIKDFLNNNLYTNITIVI